MITAKQDLLSMSNPQQSWICCQLGARENYSIPRALHSIGALEWLVTDSWVGKHHPLRFCCWNRLKQRYHPDLASARVRAWTWEAATLSALRWPHLQGWNQIIARNTWFGQKAAAAIQGLHGGQSDNPMVFSFSYTAKPVFELAKRRGWTTVLGQIDGGLVESQLVERLHIFKTKKINSRSPAPPAYWDAWKEELRLADHIIVNSNWSRQCLVQSGFVEPERITVIPLAYSPPKEASEFKRHYPPEFTPERPLRVLFLGQVTARKGVAPIFEAIRALADMPIDFKFVGPISLAVPPDLQDNPRVTFTGPVPRSQVARYYQNADVFLFPTFSDGFGLTQLEAQAWKLPVIASYFCGEVVQNGCNGMILSEVSAPAICEALRACCRNAKQLAAYSENPVSMRDYDILRLAQRMRSLSDLHHSSIAP
jgi:glycosyltransferase involved in cell wall biosynthesis